MASKQKGQSQLQGGYECSFMEDTSKDLQSECSICLNVLRQPYMVSCCGYRFCRTCIEPIQSNTRRRTCPLCNESFTSIPDRLLERTLNEKMVCCSSKDDPSDSCKWEGKLEALDDHLKMCSYQKGTARIPCSYCFEPFSHSKVIGHQKECPSRVATCEFCKTHEDTLSTLKSEHYNVCSEFPVSCPNGCGAAIPRKDIWKHIDEICPNTVVDCPFKYAGCGVQLTRREISTHSSNDDLSEHLAMTKRRIRELEEENEILKEETETLKEETETLKEETEMLKEETETLKEKLNTRPIKYLVAANLPDCVNEGMLKSLFGQHGSVQNIWLKGDLESAIIQYHSSESARAALYHSIWIGINLKSQRLCIDPLYN